MAVSLPNLITGRGYPMLRWAINKDPSGTKALG